LKARELKKMERGGQKRKRTSDKQERKNKKRDKKRARACLEPAPTAPDNQMPSPPPTQADAAKQFRDVAVFIDLAGGLPAGKFTHVFVDGNNMFYLTDKLRHFTLRGKTKTTEQVLSSVARYFAELVRLDVEIVFDAACSIPSGRNSDDPNSALPLVHLDNGSSFLISSARPTYPTSDAKLVAWARAHPLEAAQTLVVTSDRALAGELSTLGVSVAKPGTWLSCVVQIATGGNPETQIDWKGWLNAWIDKVAGSDE